MLSEYITQTQNFLNDNSGQFFDIPTLTNYVNRSRRRVAAASGCLRVMPVGTQTVPSREIYNFSDWNALVQKQMTGVQSILACKTVAISIGGKWEGDAVRGGAWKPVWNRLPWTDFQARFRIYGGTFLGTFNDPGWWAQYGSGPIGKLYLAPIPTTAQPIEVDLICLPAPLLTDNDPEPIPYPWTDAIAYWATVLALLQQQRREDAQAIAALFNTELPLCASVVCPSFISSPYTATLRPA